MQPDETGNRNSHSYAEKKGYLECHTLWHKTYNALLLGKGGV